MSDPGTEISVVIPVWNGGKYLHEAIASAVAQSCPPSEVIVVDDGSTDDSVAIAEAFGQPVRCVSQLHAGPSAARNRGADESRSEFLAFLDADDVWMARKLAWQRAAFDAEPDLEAVFGHVEHFHSPDLDEPTRARIACPNHVLPGYTHCAMLIRRSAFFRVGLFDARYRIGEFVDWFARATDRNLKVRMLDEVVLRRRLHGHNYGTVQQRHRSEFARIAKAALDHRRTAGPAES